MTTKMHNITITFVSMNTQALSEDVASKIIITFQKITLSRVLLTLSVTMPNFAMFRFKMVCRVSVCT